MDNKELDGEIDDVVGDVDVTDKQEDRKFATETKTVKVNKDSLEKLVETVKEQGEQIKILKQAADKSRLDWAQNQNKKEGARTVRVTVIGGKPVVGWRTVKDIVEKNPLTGVWVENQEYEFIFKDETVLSVMGYGKFSELHYANQVEAKVVTRTEDNNGNIVFGVELPDGNVLSLDSRFVN